VVQRPPHRVPEAPVDFRRYALYSEVLLIEKTYKDGAHAEQGDQHDKDDEKDQLAGKLPRKNPVEQITKTLSYFLQGVAHEFRIDADAPLTKTGRGLSPINSNSTSHVPPQDSGA
jgi:hypothetical protein